MEILYSFRLVLEGKTGKEIPESESSETSSPMNRGGIAGLTFLRTLLAIHQMSWESSFWEVMVSFVLVAYESGSFNNPFVTIIDLSKLYIIFRRFIVGTNENKWFLWAKAAAQPTENHVDEWDLTWYFNLRLTVRNISISSNLNTLTKFTSSSRSSLKISSHGTSLKWSWRPSQSAQE